VVIKTLGYQEHASEYGTHWNFFFTLSALAVLGTLFDLFDQTLDNAFGGEIQWIPTASLCSVFVAATYQVALSSGLSDFILHAPRTVEAGTLAESQWPSGMLWIFYHDREGICSLLGFFAIYLQGVQLGQWCLFRKMAPGKGFKVINVWLENLMLIFVIDSLLWLGFFAATLHTAEAEGGWGVSRRMVNGAYCLWVLALCTLLVGMFLAIDLLSTIPLSSIIVQAINRNQLAIFLVGNLMTGVVNLSMKTIYSSDEVGLLVIALYTGLVCSVAVLLDFYRVRIKL